MITASIPPRILYHMIFPSSKNSPLNFGSLQAPFLQFHVYLNGTVRQIDAYPMRQGTCPAMIFVGFESENQGGALTHPQYQGGLWLTRSLAGQWKIPLTREFIGSHAEVDSLFTLHPVGPFFPWAMLMKDLISEKEWVSIRHQGVPIAMGYMERGRTYASIREIAIGLGYRVHFDALENVLHVE
jgi:hypothetical protein